MRRILRFSVLLVALAAALAAWAFLIEPGRLVLTEVALASPDWPAERKPLRIVLLADLHTGAPQVGLARIEAIVQRVNALQPDLVLLAGDYVIQGVLFGRFVAPEETAARLAKLQARHGVVAVLGNHDWWLDGRRVERALTDAGITVLENRALKLELHDGALWIAGIADDITRQPDVPGTLTAVPAGEPAIVLAHDPAIFAEVPQGPIVTLAGHTHGGQVRLPFVGPVVNASRAPLRHSYGLVEEAGRQLFVTSGIGTSILPLRFNMPPEIAVLTLSSLPRAN